MQTPAYPETGDILYKTCKYDRMKAQNITKRKLFNEGKLFSSKLSNSATQTILVLNCSVMKDLFSHVLKVGPAPFSTLQGLEVWQS